MKKSTTKFLLVGVSGIMLLTACPAQTAKAGYYTYNTYLSTKPKTWNVHSWETSDESYVPAFCEMGLYDLTFNENRDGYVVTPEMAAELPKDITADAIADDEEILERYGYKGNPDEGFIWEIKLNPNAKFSDGKAINADTYIQSMERQLNPKFVNFRADSYYASSLVIAGAEKYFKSGRSTIEPLIDYIDLDTGEFKDPTVCEDGRYYLNIAHPSAYPATIFSGTSGDESLYTVLNNRSTKASNAVELAAQRITDACRYYAWKYAKRSADHKSDWDEIDEGGYSKLTNVKEEMLDINIDIEEFSEKEVLVRGVVDDSSESAAVQYSESALKADLKTIVATFNNIRDDWAWKYPLFGSKYNEVDDNFNFENNVGVSKKDDYTLVLYLKKQITALDLEFSLTSNWIVDVELYDKLTKRSETGYLTTTYASPAGGIKGYNSYGPYKLTKFESGKLFKMEKNENWYGYSDGKHVGQFQCDEINTKIITDHNVAIQEFEKGRIDDIELNRTDMKKYGNSSRKTSTYESYTQKLSFNSDRAKLLSRQTSMNAGNKTILSNIDFRKGLSLAMDRNGFASQATAGSKAFTGLLNDLYLTDVEHGEMYRSTPQGKSVYQAVYGELGGDPYADGYTPSALAESSNGYNMAMAKYYVAKALDEESKDTKTGHINKNDKISIEFRVYDTESESTIEALAFIRKQFSDVIAEANKVLNTNYSIEVVAQKDEDYYNSAKSGNYDLIFSIWGGAATNPIGLFQVYCDTTFESCCEYGFKGKQKNVTIDIDANGNGTIDTAETKSFNDWWAEISNMAETDEYGSAAWTTKHNYILNVLAGLEAGILNRFEAIPLVARASSSLNSFKIENGSKTYINLMGYGGIRYMTFNFDDAGWASFLKEHKNDYTELMKQ